MTDSVPSGHRLRIVVGADTYSPDVNGAARFAGQLAAGLASRGHEVHVLAPAPEPVVPPNVEPGDTPLRLHRLRSRGVPVHPTIRTSLPWEISGTVEALLRQIQPDLVHVQSHFVIGRTLLRTADRRGIPTVATNHFMPQNLFGYARLPRWLRDAAARWAWRDLRQAFSGVTVLTAPTPRAAQLLRTNGWDRAVTPISCGIDLGRYRSLPPTVRGPILFVGRLDEEKHVDELIRALALLPADLDTQLEVVGDGNQHGQLEALSARLGVRERVWFRGMISDERLLDAYARCSVFCMPGTAELQSLATLEAMAAATPIVAVNTGALPHLVDEGTNGWLYPPGDTAALADRLTRVLHLSAPRRAEFGAASRNLAAHHDQNATLDEFELLYRTAVRRRTPAAVIA